MYVIDRHRCDFKEKHLEHLQVNTMLSLCVCILCNSMYVLMSCVFAIFQLYRASVLFETIRHEMQHSTDYKLSLFDLQTSSYQALQRVLVSLGELTVL